MGRPRDSKKNNPSASTSSVAGSSKSSAPLKIKIPRSEALSKDKQKRQFPTGTKKRPIILGKIPEDDDIEEKDIPVEEQFILRLIVPEDVKQKFREKVKNGKFTDDIGIVFKDPRRAIFTFENQKYRARLVDLPCIIEAQKTFNKVQYYKVADICQMLIVESQIQEDEQIFTENSKSSNVDEFEWPDGLTPPLKNVRKRRFRKRISAKKIEDIEKEVEKLLHEDSLAEEVKLGWEDALDSETATPAAYIGSKAPEEEEQEEVEVQGEEEDYDAELEEDTTVLGEEILDEDQMYTTPDDDLQKEFENALEKFDEMSDSAEDSDKNGDEETTDSETSTSTSNEDDDDSVDEDHEDPELTQIFNKREELTTEIARLEEDIRNLESHFASAINPLIQGRLTGKIASAKEEIVQKRQEIEACDKRISEIHERMKAQVAELKRITKVKMKGKGRESEEDSENESENENSSDNDDEEQNEEENNKGDKQEEDKRSKKDDSIFLLGEDEFYEELDNKDDDDNKGEMMIVDDGQAENDLDESMMDIEDDDKDKFKENSENESEKLIETMDAGVKK